ncbi:hypothetical protein TREMEDRAFT_27166 [Tremella mesenterica DSM 1558]|uniref:uncharacterized protein n=1 Tax=Tremella mesenterica (strain ATCC 24925 / CBS 8224 / DSM 1558 / NBRC 9311 / NRRL Y-6157 / RJB 2259-6 / UBC 559-6) TaxID=578456 RepID=UPI0003F49AA7|nr:uncharacterized protein TREMEDRAFT_27166 [Tremella mesenterica DSM 1558]EIW71234.1 hypothetical protein TREMEDRAFT_27166 [Tremella mesenterica DSM 1558]
MNRNFYTSSIILSQAPFTRIELSRIRSLLLPAPTEGFVLPPHTARNPHGEPIEAAVLIPLMNVDNRPHILFEVRSSGMRSHAGEVSFPGGKSDPTDSSLISTALREAEEELSLSPSNVEILGSMGPEYSLGNKTLSQILCIPLSTISDPNRHTIHHFRLNVHRPYYKIQIGDLTPQNDDLEIWGLSGWFLNNLAWRLRWWDRPLD